MISLSRCIRNAAIPVGAFASLGGFPDAWAVDVSPGAYLPAPADSSIAMLYLGGGRATEFHPEKGATVNHGTQLDTRTGLIRLFHMIDVDQTRLQVQLGLPFGSQKLKMNGVRIGDDSGLADPFLAITAWPLNDTVNKRYLGITGYVFFPQGSYDHDSRVNMGNNRYGAALQAGYVQSFGAWRAELTGDVSWYGDNTDSTPAERTLKQDPVYTLQPWLSYTFDNKVTTSVGLTRTWGGNSTLDGIDTGRRSDSTRARVGLGYWVRKDVQLYSELTRDLQVEGGYKFDYSGFVRIGYFF
ncbi:transporter [Pseudomonas sp. HN11]|uniref:transporter n=1 Tax=Pseudomonas sp. HN11 TaxID=1344094 RepID=UPI001F3FB908|nr:transporter [Pseudomonas sp. HN11]UII69879.1 transporter [Pseudomonas sp. HN11]